MKKGTTIANFLQRALEILRKEFSELRIATTDHLMFVKEDLIIPHFYTSVFDRYVFYASVT